MVRLGAVLVLLLVLLGAYLRAANLGGPAFCCDEFYDVFAAKSWLAGEGFAVPGREYTRARLNTYLTAGAFALLGESEAAARVPPLLLGLATMVVVYAAGRRLFGAVAGAVALGLVALSPHAVDVSRFARLYSGLTLATLVAAFALYRVLEGREAGPRVEVARVGWLALAAGAGLVAAHLHPIALALGPSVLAYAALRAGALGLAGRGEEARRYGLVALGLAAVAAALMALPAVREGVIEAALTPLPWYEPAPDDGWTYHAHLAGKYAWLWFLVWPATIVASLAYPRAGLFTASALWVPFVLLSAVVATKHPRYAVHLLPFAWLLLGAAAGAAWPRVRAALLEVAAARLPVRLRDRPAAGAAFVGLVLVIVLAPVVRASPSVVEAVRRHTETTGHFTTGRYQEWRELAARLGPRLAPDARIVSTTWHAPIYYLHRPTNHLLPAFRQRGEGDWETPERTAEGQVQTAADLERLLARGQPLWVLARRSGWEREGYLDEGLTRLVETRCRRERLPAGASVVAFDCGRARAGDPSDRPPVRALHQPLR